MWAWAANSGGGGNWRRFLEDAGDVAWPERTWRHSLGKRSIVTQARERDKACPAASQGAKSTHTHETVGQTFLSAKTWQARMPAPRSRRWGRHSCLPKRGRHSCLPHGPDRGVRFTRKPPGQPGGSGCLRGSFRVLPRSADSVRPRIVSGKSPKSTRKRNGPIWISSPLARAAWLRTALAVQVGAVAAAQVRQRRRIVHDPDGAVMPAHFLGAQPQIAIGAAADQELGFLNGNVARLGGSLTAFNQSNRLSHDESPGAKRATSQRLSGKPVLVATGGSPVAFLKDDRRAARRYESRQTSRPSLRKPTGEPPVATSQPPPGIAFYCTSSS